MILYWVVEDKRFKIESQLTDVSAALANVQDAGGAGGQ